MSALSTFLLLLHLISAINIFERLQVVLVPLLLLFDVVFPNPLHGHLPLLFQLLTFLLLALSFLLEIAHAFLFFLVSLLVDIVYLLLLLLLVSLLVPFHLL